MADIQRIRVELTGITALPGVATFYSEVAVPSAKADITTFFTSIAGLMPNGLQITVPNSGDVIDDTDGSLTGVWTEGTASTIGASGSGVYAAGVGARVVWGTNGIRNRRRVRGSTFICPMVASEFDSTGTIGSSALTTLRNAATVLASSGLLRVWSRPTSVVAADGASHTVLNGSVPDRVTALRSRRY